MASIESFAGSRHGLRAEVRALEASSIESAFVLPDSSDQGPAARKRWLATGLFWLGVAALIAARVVLFDPSAARPIGGFSDLIGLSSR
jgi:hypothetical protein